MKVKVKVCEAADVFQLKSEAVTGNQGGREGKWSQEARNGSEQKTRFDFRHCPWVFEEMVNWQKNIYGSEGTVK